MTHKPVCTGLLIFAAGILGQAAPPQFEVVSIRPAPATRGGPRMRVSGGSIDFTNVSLRDMVTGALQIDDSRVSFSSTSSKRFTVKATMPAGTSPDDVPGMLQSMLEERFKLKAHREARTEDVWLLLPAADGPRLKKSAVAEPSRPDFGKIPLPGNRGREVIRMVDPNTVHVELQDATMAGLCRFLSRNLRRPVLDRTGITGQYDMDLDASVTSPIDLAPKPGPVPLPPGPPTIAVVPALKQLGLRLKPGRERVEFVIIDSALETPTEQ